MSSLNEKIIRITPKTFDNAIELAQSILTSNGVIVFPTDTSYGIGTLWNNERGIRKILEIKKRPVEMGLPLLFGNLAAVLEFCELSDVEYAIAKRYWPGALTLITQPRYSLPLIQGRHNTIAVRIPQNLFLLDLLNKLNAPLIGTSANLSGAPSPHKISVSIEYFGELIDLYIDDGDTLHALDSTIIHVANDKISILRKGPVNVDIKNLSVK